MTEKTGTATAEPEKTEKDLSAMSVAELDALIDSRHKAHNASQKYLRALLRAKVAMGDF